MNKAVIHALKMHANESNFQVECMFPQCMYISKSWPAFRKHCSRKHGLKSIQDLTNCPIEDLGLGAEIANEIDPDLLHSLTQEGTETTSELSVNTDTLMGKFMLSLEARHHLTRKGLTEVASNIEELTERLSFQVQEYVKSALHQDPNSNVSHLIAESCRVEVNSFSNDRSRLALYEDKFLYLPPCPIYLGQSTKTIGYYVPFERLLQLLCRQDQIWRCILYQQDKRQQGDLLKDYSDGEFLQEHPLSNKHEPFLQVALAYDDLELQNPLRSNKRHKLAMFYVTILNIPPVYRSQLQNIFALAIAPVQAVKKHGFIVVLQDFLSTMATLKTSGVLISDRGVNLRGDLIVALCDTPAAAALGGFKGSSSFSEHFCRTCMASQKDFCDYRQEAEFELRDLQSYMSQCTDLENADLAKRKQFWSKMYGLNERSALCAIPGFDVTQCLLQDPMHVILEGCLPYVLALFLKDVIYDRRLLTLSMLNDFLLEPCQFQQERRDLVVPIEPKQIKKDEHIKQKASTMLAISYRLPFLFGQHVPANDDAYCNLLSMIRITCICFKPTVDSTLAGVLSQEIADFLESFCRLYTAAKVKPKMHFMIHFPRQMLKFGPLRHHSTMRAEAKHQSFKDHRWMNFNNLPMSLLKRHQIRFADAFTDTNGAVVKNFLQENSGACSKSRSKAKRVGDFEKDVRDKLIQSFQLEQDCIVQEDSSVQWRGRIYDDTCCILLSESESNGPCFGKIDRLICNGSALYAVIDEVSTAGYCPEFNAYEVTILSRSRDVADMASGYGRWPVPMYRIDNATYVVNRYGILTS